MLCNTVDRYRRFGETCCFHLRGRRCRQHNTVPITRRTTDSMTLRRYANHRFHPFRCLAKSEDKEVPQLCSFFYFFPFLFFSPHLVLKSENSPNTPVENPPLVSLCFSSDVVDVPRIHPSSLMELSYINLKYTCRTITAPPVTKK
jgi:hypothetical protein